MGGGGEESPEATSLFSDRRAGLLRLFSARNLLGRLGPLQPPQLADSNVHRPPVSSPTALGWGVGRGCWLPVL